MAPRLDSPILGFGLNNWDTYWQTRQHVLSRLSSRNWRVGYTVPIQSIWDRDTPRWRDARWFGRVVEQDGVTVVYPGRLPMVCERWPSFDRTLMARHGARFANIMRNGTSGVVVAYVFHPFFFPYVQRLDGAKVIFHADDRFSAMPGWNEELAARQHALVERADWIFASTEGVARSLGSGACGKTQLLPNGADTDRFLAGQLSPVPDDLALIPRPRLGYAGSLNEKVDFALIDRIAERRSDWHWVLVGPRWSERYLKPETRRFVESCERRANVHFLPTKAFWELPAYYAHMDINVLCYRSDEEGWWRDIYPLKLHECLASGRPVVSSDLPAVRKFSDVVVICTTVDEWTDQIAQLLAGREVATRDARLAVARANDWNVRIDVIERRLTEVCRPMTRPSGVLAQQAAPLA
jgi:glycosyltransferase involved in cell wall biosynthesis